MRAATVYMLTEGQPCPNKQSFSTLAYCYFRLGSSLLWGLAYALHDVSQNP